MHAIPVHTASPSPVLSLRAFARGLAAAAAATIVVVFVYAAVQQAYRTAADDPQAQWAGDAAAALAHGAAAATVVPATTVDPSSSLAPFIVVVGGDGRALAGSCRIGGAVPVPPAGVLARARADGEYRVTWRPPGGVRVAAVLHRVDDGSGRVVVAGRSLREVEERTSRLLAMSALAWAALLVSAVAAALL
jgi:hypothetical protein